MDNQYLKYIVVTLYEALDEIENHINYKCLTEGDMNEVRTILADCSFAYKESKSPRPESN